MLRIALFCDILPLPIADTAITTLAEKRKLLADLLRSNRKKGIIPVFVSMAWFVVSLAISIQSSFEQFRSNETVENLGLGLSLGWLPILVMSTIVDRNPIGTDKIRLELNNFLDIVRDALLDSATRSIYAARMGKDPEYFDWIFSRRDQNLLPHGFFTHFAGQGRLHWHVSFAILL